MYYEIRGSGKPLVLIPGWGTEISTLEAQIKDIAEKYTVIAVDNRGTGRTDKPDIPYTIEEMADDLISLLDLLHIEQTNILGISMGSMIAQAIAGRYPDRVDHLVLHLGFTRIPLPVKIIMTLMVILPGSKKKMEEGMNTLILGQQYPPTPESLRRQGEAVRNFDGRKYLGKITAKTLILNGNRDILIPMKISHELANGIPGAKLICIEGDHLVFRTDTEKVLGPMFVFLNGLR